MVSYGQDNVTSMIGRTLHTLGEVMIALTVLLVHHKMLKDHKLDKPVFREIQHEQVLGGLGLILIVGGYTLELLGY